MLFESINLFFMNIMYRLSERLGSRGRSLTIFACCLVMCAVFSLWPRSEHDERRMLLLSIVSLLLTAACIDDKPSSVRWNIPMTLSIELFAVGIIVVLSIHPVGGGYLTFALDILFVFPMLYMAVINKKNITDLIDSIAGSATVMGLICFIYSIILIRGGKEDLEVVGRMAGAIKNPNYYGMAGLVMLIASVYLMLRLYSNIVLVIPTALVAGSGLSMIIKAISRTAVIATFFCFVLLAIYLSKTRRDDSSIPRKRKLAVLLFILIAALGVSGGILLQRGTDEAYETSQSMRRFASETLSSVCNTVYAEDGDSQEEDLTFWNRFDFINEDAYTFSNGRTSLWRTYYGYLNMMGNDYDSLLKNGQIPMRAHNNLIDYSFRLGITKGMLYLVFYIVIIAQTARLLFGNKQLKPEDLWLMMIVGSYVLYSMVEISTLPFTRYIPCLFFLSIGPLMGSPTTPYYAKYDIAEGISEFCLYLMDTDGNNAKVHVLKIKKNSGARVIAGCSAGIMRGEPKYQSSLSSIVKAFNDSHKETETAVAASSGDFYNLKTGEPSGALVMKGQLMSEPGKRPFLAVCKDGSFTIKAGGEINDVIEAVGGRQRLLYKGKIKVEKVADKHPRQAIGVCEDGSLMIVNVEGRQPDSRGVRLYDLAAFMKKEGCVDAINLDGGGSAGFMTKRTGDAEPVFRNVPGDGYERNIASAILVVRGNHEKRYTKDSEFGKITKPEHNVHPEIMFDEGSYLDRTLFGRYIYLQSGSKPSGVFNLAGGAYLFKSGRGITETIRIGEIGYNFKKGAYVGSTDQEAGDVVFGYCGARGDGRNLIFALHKGDWLLNIGLNYLDEADNTVGISGEMEDWDTTQEQNLPWYAYRHSIKRVYIADGVTTIGSRFLFLPKGKTKGGTETPASRLEDIRLPKSIREIGSFAFYNKPLVKKVMIPSKDVKLGPEAFDKETELLIVAHI